MSIPQHLCSACGHVYASNEDCRACQCAMACEAVNVERRKARVLEDMHNAAKWAPANRRFRVLTPSGRSIGL